MLLTCTDTEEPIISMSVNTAYTVFVSQASSFIYFSWSNRVFLLCCLLQTFNLSSCHVCAGGCHNMTKPPPKIFKNTIKTSKIL